MTIVTYVPVIEATAIPDGTMRAVDMDGRVIVVAHTDGGYFAFQPDCPHAGTKLALGSLEGKGVVCPNHNYVFDLETGKLVEPDVVCEDLTTYKIEERDGMLCLRLEF